MKLLTGKAKEHFEKWYFKNHVKTNKKFSQLLPHEYSDIYDWLYGSVDTIKNAFIIDWFHSVDIGICIVPLKDKSINKFNYNFSILKIEESFIHDYWFYSKEEAETEAIEKANEIYNNQQP